MPPAQKRVFGVGFDAVEQEERLLLVEDDESWRNVLAALLRSNLTEVEIDVVGTYTGAVEKLESESYACVVCDYALEEETGLSVLEAVQDRDPDVPFLLITGRGSEKIASEAIDRGVTDYILKDEIDARGKLLVNRIDNALVDRRKQLALEKERRVKSAIGEIIGDGTGHNDIYDEFCAQLVTHAGYDLVWIAQHGNRGSVVSRGVARSESSIHEYVLPTGPIEASDDPTVTALREDELVEFPSPDTSLATELESRDAEWVHAGFTHVLGIPIRYDGIEHGALGVYSSEGSFTDHDRQILQEYADVIGFTFQTEHWKESMLSKSSVHIKVAVTDESVPHIALANAVSDGERVEILSIFGQADDQYLYILATDGPAYDDIVEYVTTDSRLSLVRGHDDGTTYELTIEGETPEARAGAYGAQFHGTVIENGTATITLSVPERGNVSELSRVLGERFDNVHVSTINETHDRVHAQFGRDLFDSLTQKQLEFIEYAYRAGFFERPQQATAEDVATAFDISSTTALHHIRTGERKLIEAAIETLRQ